MEVVAVARGGPGSAASSHASVRIASGGQSPSLHVQRAQLLQLGEDHVHEVRLAAHGAGRECLQGNDASSLGFDLRAQLRLPRLDLAHHLAELLDILDALPQHAGAQVAGVRVAQHLLHAALHVDPAVEGERDLAGPDPARDRLLRDPQDAGELGRAHPHPQQFRSIQHEGQRPRRRALVDSLRILIGCHNITSHVVYARTSDGTQRPSLGTSVRQRAGGVPFDRPSAGALLVGPDTSDTCSGLHRHACARHARAIRSICEDVS